MYKHFFKRLFDLIVCLMGLPVFFLIFIVVAPIIKLTDGGPVFYNAERLGKGGKLFKMYKFRSMKVDAPNLLNKDGSTYNGKNDPRVTKIGRILRKTSLDETPQIFNVLFGHMSIIGPRAHILTRFKSYDELDDVRKHRLEVRPGITGYSQAYFRNSASNDEKIQQDVYYVDNLTLWMDIKVFFKTIGTVLKRDNVYVKDEAPVKVVTVDANGNRVEANITAAGEKSENKETVGAAD